MLAWKAHGNSYMSKLKEESVGLTTDRKLESFAWKLAMPIAASEVDSSKLNDVMPNARAAVAELAFEVQGDTAALRLSKTQLQAFYEELERVQIRLDDLAK